MLIVNRDDLARNLAAYGELELSERTRLMSDEQFKRVCEIGFRHALTGMHLLKCSCLAAVEVLEGKPRELKRKRRRWTGLSRSISSTLPMFEAVQRRFEKYSGGQPLRKAQILEQLSQIVSRSMPSFKYFKSSSEFRCTFRSGYSFIGFSYGHGSLALQFGVRHHDIAEIEARMFPTDYSTRRLATISMLSVNMGPRSPHWPYPTETTWPISGTQGLRLASSEIVAFIRGCSRTICHAAPRPCRNAKHSVEYATPRNIPGRQSSDNIRDRSLARSTRLV